MYIGKLERLIRSWADRKGEKLSDEHIKSLMREYKGKIKYPQVAEWLNKGRSVWPNPQISLLLPRCPSPEEKQEQKKRYREERTRVAEDKVLQETAQILGPHAEFREFQDWFLSLSWCYKICIAKLSHEKRVVLRGKLGAELQVAIATVRGPSEKKKKKKKRPKSKTKKSCKSRKPNHDYLDTVLWTEVIRPRILLRDGYRCQVCGSKERLHVHHRSYSRAVMRGEDDGKLITLCRCHHLDVHFVSYFGKNDPRNIKRVRPNVEARLLELIDLSFAIWPK